MGGWRRTGVQACRRVCWRVDMEAWRHVGMEAWIFPESLRERVEYGRNKAVSSRHLLFWAPTPKGPILAAESLSFLKAPPADPADYMLVKS